MTSHIYTLIIICLSVSVGIPVSAAAQEECDSYCNEPATFCSSTACFDGRLRTTCKQFNTNYGSSPQICTEPPPGLGSIRYPSDGIEWNTSPGWDTVGNCRGNCGAGCSDHYNPCGGPTQYWQLTYLQAPVYGTWETYRCQGPDLWYDVWIGYKATGRWTYHGWAAPGCVTHDQTCPEWSFLGCLWWAGCGSPTWGATWYYDLSLTHNDGFVSRTKIQPGGCIP
jgi:hypothetical protein